MCGRTACTLAPEEIRRACRYLDRQGRHRTPQWRDGDQNKYAPSYNKSPQSNSPVLVSQRHFQKEPFFKGQRCVVLADGFYEWQRSKTEIQPYFIYFPQDVNKVKNDPEELVDSEVWNGWRLLTIAGLFDCWKSPVGGEPLYSYTIITVEASKAMKGIHDRMPAVLDGEDKIRRWLDFGEIKAQEAFKLIHPIEAICLHPVSSIVNNSRNNVPERIKPIEPDSAEKSNRSGNSKMMLNWLAKGSPKKAEPAPSPTVKTEMQSFKRSSASLMQSWLQKPGGSMAKRPRSNRDSEIP
ncbi:abasic site processing protein HMCES isoform X2 [Erpetoichthys calabaricus]|uniref:abasic site processing protein HMCES isoform X2 n=1 Tax=Erpetoichthys calabaricus TaxID=27687 RepID=UPI00109F5182|nr:abasic site processing protein HMCES isoform X2 [Erpetoichthys calabaricus]